MSLVKRKRFEDENEQNPEPIKLQEIRRLKKDRGELIRAERIISKHGLSNNFNLFNVITEINAVKHQKLVEYVINSSPENIVNDIELLAKLAR